MCHEIGIDLHRVKQLKLRLRPWLSDNLSIIATVRVQIALAHIVLVAETWFIVERRFSGLTSGDRL